MFSDPYMDKGFLTVLCSVYKLRGGKIMETYSKNFLSSLRTQQSLFYVLSMKSHSCGVTRHAESSFLLAALAQQIPAVSVCGSFLQD